ncbi:DUF397 domain-containing protein [Streptomyces millisiae]|uniref:DUF397 domain-containing protein n=1 Tax=Streptomyces millisiae TaxID=3075542 RepID=A0ABU2LRT0_9ACTN|nr:DUF397 domain-containing protein [Streptomyces sp. DSM 44918]MDT0320306.1 DUF397 domain-containing protein [Streptomyces sp. DSM 44918]
MTQPGPSPDDLAAATWIKSSASGAQNECVEVAHLGPWTGVRDSKDPARATVIVPAGAFARLVSHLARG